MMKGNGLERFVIGSNFRAFDLVPINLLTIGCKVTLEVSAFAAFYSVVISVLINENYEKALLSEV